MIAQLILSCIIIPDKFMEDNGVGKFTGLLAWKVTKSVSIWIAYTRK